MLWTPKGLTQFNRPRKKYDRKYLDLHYLSLKGLGL